MPQELKRRLEDAAQEAGVTRNDWVLRSIEATLTTRDAESRKREGIEQIEGQLDIKYQEFLTALAVKHRLGDLAALTGSKRMQLEAEADELLQKWDDGSHTAPMNALERLCKEYAELGRELQDARSTDKQENMDTNYIGFDLDDDELDDDEGYGDDENET
jgi:hypothetical protein